MDYRVSSDLIIVRLHQDEDLFACLEEICRQTDLKVGVIVSGIGMLKQAELAYYVSSGRYAPVLFPEPMELVSLTGSLIVEDEDCHIHLHAVLSRENKETVGGHLSRGKVNVTGEIVILKSDAPARRVLDEATGLMSLSFGGQKHEPDAN
jgi:predicted DNA-binding protein with PD1-like motif